MKSDRRLQIERGPAPRGNGFAITVLIQDAVLGVPCLLTRVVYSDPEFEAEAWRTLRLRFRADCRQRVCSFTSIGRSPRARVLQ